MPNNGKGMPPNFKAGLISPGRNGKIGADGKYMRGSPSKPLIP